MSEGQEKQKPKRKCSQNRKRTFQVLLPLNKEEHQHLARLAKIANTTRQTVLRALLMERDLKPARIYPDEVYRAIIGLGRNWNQAVTKLHSTGEIPNNEVNRLLKELKELYTCLSSK